MRTSRICNAAAFGPLADFSITLGSSDAEANLCDCQMPGCERGRWARNMLFCFSLRTGPGGRTRLRASSRSRIFAAAVGHSYDPRCTARGSASKRLVLQSRMSAGGRLAPVARRRTGRSRPEAARRHREGQLTTTVLPLAVAPPARPSVGLMALTVSSRPVVQRPQPLQCCPTVSQEAIRLGHRHRHQACRSVFG